MDFHCLSDVDIWSANDEIMKRHDRELDLISFIKIGQVDVGAELLSDVQILSSELDVGFLIGLVHIVTFLAFAIAGGDGRVMSDLLRQVLKVIIDELKRLTEQWIEGLRGCSLTNRQRRDNMNSD